MKTAEEIDAANRFHSYVRGWKDGAYGKAMDPKFTQHATLGGEYDKGYTDGYQARGEMRRQAAQRYGHEESILRLARRTPDAGKGTAK